MDWTDLQREQFEQLGCIVLKGALSAAQLQKLNQVYDEQIAAAVSENQRGHPYRRTPMTSDGKYSPLEAGCVTNDGHRFRLEPLNHDLPGGSRFWDQSFIDLVDLPGVIEIVTELLSDEARWYGLGARAPPLGAPVALRLSHHNMFFRPPWGQGAPADVGGGLHGGGSRNGPATISVAYELRDVKANCGGFGWIKGSHIASFALPQHDMWRNNWATSELRGPSWPEHAVVYQTVSVCMAAMLLRST